jgi:DNA-binding PadR family transcriptional regulator
MSSSIDREFRLTFWKLHILHHAARRPVYGLWLLEELAAHGHLLSPGTLYPLLARMEARGWLRGSAAGAGLKARRDYRITAEGRKLLDRLRSEVDELHRELVLGEEPDHAPVGGDVNRRRRTR